METALVLMELAAIGRQNLTVKTEQGTFLRAGCNNGANCGADSVTVESSSFCQLAPPPLLISEK